MTGKAPEMLRLGQWPLDAGRRNLYRSVKTRSFEGRRDPPGQPDAELVVYGPAFPVDKQRENSSAGKAGLNEFRFFGKFLLNNFRQSFKPCRTPSPRL